MSFLADRSQAGYVPRQDHRSGVPVGRRLGPSGLRVVDPGKGDDEEAGFAFDDEDGGTLGDEPGWRHWPADTRDCGAWSPALICRVTSSEASDTDAQGRTVTGKVNRLTSVTPVRTTGYAVDEDFKEAGHTLPEFWPSPPKGFVMLGTAGTREDAQADLLGFLDPRIPAVNKNGMDDMGARIIDCDPEATASAIRSAKAQTHFRVAHIPLLGDQIKNNPAWVAAWQHATTGQGKEVGLGAIYGTLDGGGDKGASLPVVTEGSGQPPGGVGVQGTLPGGNASKAKRGVALTSKDAWGPLHCGHEQDKHRFATNDDNEPVNSAHLDVLRHFWYLDQQRDAPMEFDQIPYGPVRAPMRVATWLRYDALSVHSWNGLTPPGLWRWESESFFTQKSPPPTTPPGMPPPSTPTPRVPTITPPYEPARPRAPQGQTEVYRHVQPLPISESGVLAGGSGGAGAPGAGTGWIHYDADDDTIKPGLHPRGKKLPAIPPPAPPPPPSPEPKPTTGWVHYDPRSKKVVPGLAPRPQKVVAKPPPPPPKKIPPPPKTPPEEPLPSTEWKHYDPESGKLLPGLHPMPWLRRPANKVRAWRNAEAVDRSAYEPEAVAWAPTQLGFSGALVFPQHFGRLGVDLRLSAMPDAESVEEARDSTPAIGRWDSWGYESGNTWGYTTRPGYSRAPGGTAPGGMLWMPPEVDVADDGSSLTPTGVTTSETFLGWGPGASAAWGVPNRATGGMTDSSWRMHRDVTGAYASITMDVQVASAWTNAFSFIYDTNGVGVGVGGTAYFKVPSGTTAQRPAAPANGMIRNNTTTSLMEARIGGAWKNVGFTQASGWTSPTGTDQRSGFDTAAATLTDVAQTLKSLVGDLLTAGILTA